VLGEATSALDSHTEQGNSGSLEPGFAQPHVFSDRARLSTIVGADEIIVRIKAVSPSAELIPSFWPTDGFMPVCGTAAEARRRGSGWRGSLTRMERRTGAPPPSTTRW